MNLYSKFKRLKFGKTLGALGAGASIVGLILYFTHQGNNKQIINVQGDIVDSNIIQIIDPSQIDVEALLKKTKKTQAVSNLPLDKLESKDDIFYKHEIERALKYFPSGYKKEKYMLNGKEYFNIGPGELNAQLKVIFEFMNQNFGKSITGKQFKQIEKIAHEVVKSEPFFTYGWYYRGLMFAFVGGDKTLVKRFKKIANMHFTRANELFDLLLDKDPQNPYLLLYKGLNLTFLNNGRASVTYLDEALRIKPDIFSEHRRLGIISHYKHIGETFSEKWESALAKY